MNHGNATPRPNVTKPTDARFAELNHEYLSADPARKEAIGREVQAIIDGKVVPFGGKEKR